MAKNTRGSPNPWGGSQGTEAVFDNPNGSAKGSNQGTGGNHSIFNQKQTAQQPQAAASVVKQQKQPRQQAAPPPVAPPPPKVVAPQMGTTMLPGASTGAPLVAQSYYANPAQLPASGGFVRPTAGPGMMQGAGLNWTVPPPPVQQQAPRNALAQLISQNRYHQLRGGGGDSGRS